LSNTLTSARLEIYEQEPEESEISRLLTSGELDAFALNRQTSVEMANAMPELRVVGDSFLDVPQAFVVRKGETAKAGALEAFVDELRASGFIEMSLADAGLLGAVGVAPPGLP
jgi:ABC-type amino acid transport substrate-binding protein